MAAVIMYLRFLVRALLIVLVACTSQEIYAQHTDSRLAQLVTSCKKAVSLFYGCVNDLTAFDPRSDISVIRTQQPLKKPSDSDLVNDTARYTLQTIAHIADVKERQQSQMLRLQNASFECACKMSCTMLSNDLHTGITSPQAQLTFDQVMLAELDEQRTQQLSTTIAALRANNNNQSADKLERLFSLSTLMAHPALIPQLIDALDEQGLPKLPTAKILSYLTAPYEVDIYDSKKMLKTGTLIRDFRCRLPREHAQQSGTLESPQNRPTASADS